MRMNPYPLKGDNKTKRRFWRSPKLLNESTDEVIATQGTMPWKTIAGIKKIETYKTASFIGFFIVRRETVNVRFHSFTTHLSRLT